MLLNIFVYYADGSTDAFPDVTEFGDEDGWRVLKLGDGTEEHIPAANVRRMTVKPVEP